MEKQGDKKLAELILYISEKSESDPRFGAVKLNKILFFSDAIAYGKMGAAITGQEYQRLPWGPAPRRLLPVRDQLRADEELAIRKTDRFGQEQDRTIALRPADLDAFSGAEIAIVDEVIQALWDRNAAEVSDLSHRVRGWQLASEGETIPYESIFLSDRPLTDAEKAHAETIRA